MEIIHSGNKEQKLIISKIFFYRETEKGNQLNDKNAVFNSEICEIVLNREMQLTSSLHHLPSP